MRRLLALLAVAMAVVATVEFIVLLGLAEHLERKAMVAGALMWAGIVVGLIVRAGQDLRDRSFDRVTFIETLVLIGVAGFSVAGIATSSGALAFFAQAVNVLAALAWVATIAAYAVGAPAQVVVDEVEEIEMFAKEASAGE